MSKDEAIKNFRSAIAGIINLAVEEMPDFGKIALAEALMNDENAFRLHVALSPFTVLGVLMPTESGEQAVELFRIGDPILASGPSEATH